MDLTKNKVEVKVGCACVADLLPQTRLDAFALSLQLSADCAVI